MKIPPNIYVRRYKTAPGYTRVLYCPRFLCWDKKRRTFVGRDNLKAARDELIRLRELNRQHADFDMVLAPLSEPIKIEGLYIWIDRFLKIKAKKKSADRDQISAMWLKEFFADGPLDGISNARMLEYRLYRAEKVSDSTINRELAFLRGVLILAHDNGALLKKPKIPLTPEHNERTRIASEDEYARIVAHLRDETLRPEIVDIIVLLKETGLRQGEILRITPAALDLREHTIDMRGIREKHGTLYILPLSDTAWNILSTHCKNKLPKAPLFPGINRFHVYNAWDWACTVLQISNLRVHDLRGTFVTEKERLGWPRKVIMSFTGHREESVFRRYSRPTLGDLRQYVQTKTGNAVER